MVGSLAVHVLLAAAVWLVPVSPVRTGDRSDRGGGEAVSYLDLGDFPGAGGGTAGAAAAGETGIGAFPAPDSIPSRLPPAAPTAPTSIPPSVAPTTGAARPADAGMRFPVQTPTGIPGTSGPSGGRPGGAGAAGASSGAAGQGTGAGGMGDAGAEGRGGGRFEPGYRDPRLYTPREIPPEAPPTDIQRYRARLQARLDVFNDSVADEAAHQRRIRNWTFKGKDGKEYGIADGGVPIVAGRRIPLPVGITVPVPRSPDRDDEAQELARERAQIERQAQDQDRDRYIRERNRATRARQDSIRRARKP